MRPNFPKGTPDAVARRLDAMERRIEDVRRQMHTHGVPSPAPTRVAGLGDHIWVSKSTAHTAAVGTTFVSFDQIFRQGGSSFSWDVGTPSVVTVNQDGVYVVSAAAYSGTMAVPPIGGLLSLGLVDSQGTFENSNSSQMSSSADAETVMSASVAGWLPSGTELKLQVRNGTGTSQSLAGSGADSGYGPAVQAVRIL